MSSPLTLPHVPEILPDIQSEAPAHALALPAVGVAAMKMPVNLDAGRAIATITASVDVPADQRGAHMSRFGRAIDRLPAGLSPQEFAARLADGLLELHSYARSSAVDLRVDRVVGERVIPVRARAWGGTLPPAPLAAAGTLELRLFGSTACPCSFAMSGDRYAHVQRAELVVELRDPVVSEAELVPMLEEAFSAPVAMVLNRAAEKALVDRIFARPRFVEDVAREAVRTLARAHAGSSARVVATAFESIHPYDCFASWEGPLR